jgi:micrococcal nuclease
MRRLLGGVCLGPVVLLLVSGAFAQQWRTCTRVIDGDTIELDGGEKVRLVGIDTPELTESRKSVLLFAQMAQLFMQSLLEGKRVRLEYDQDRTDKYGRTLAYIFLEDGTFVNAAAVQQGYAFAYVKYPFKYMDDFKRYEGEARENRRGLWYSDIQKPATVEQGLGIAALAGTKTTVYITRSGAKYHSEGCRSLSKSKIPISLEDAIQKGYTPCSRCNPPEAGPAAERSKVAAEPATDITVYVTRTGSKYHRGSCSSLSRSRIPKSLKDACAAGYTPCSRCNPPRCK